MPRSRESIFLTPPSITKPDEPLRLALKRRPDLWLLAPSRSLYAYDRAGAEAAFEEARRALDMDVIPIFLSARAGRTG